MNKDAHSIAFIFHQTLEGYANGAIGNRLVGTKQMLLKDVKRTFNSYASFSSCMRLDNPCETSWALVSSRARWCYILPTQPRKYFSATWESKYYALSSWAQYFVVKCF